MPSRPRFLRFVERSTMPASAFPALAAVIWCAAIAGAQTPTPPNTPQQPTQSRQPQTPNTPQTIPAPPPVQTDDKTKQQKPMPPANPLIIFNPETGTGNDVRNHDKDGKPIPNGERPVDHGDFRNLPYDTRYNSHRQKPLKLFGYDFFAPSRNLILAKQQSYMRAYNGDTVPGLTPQRRPGNYNGYAYGPQNGRAIGSNGGVNRQGQGQYPPGAGRGNANNRPRQLYDENGYPVPMDLFYQRNQQLPQNPTDQLDQQDQQDQQNNAPNRTRRSVNNPDSSDQTNPSPDEMDQSGEGTDNGSEEDLGAGGGAPPPDLTPEERANYLDQQDRRRRTLMALPDSEATSAAQARRQRIQQQRIQQNLNAPDQDFNQQFNQNGQPNYNNGNQVDQNDQFGDNGFLSPDNAGPQPVDARNKVSGPLDEMFNNIKASVPPTYPIGGGDSVRIRYFSPTLQAKQMDRTVDERGALNVGEAGFIVVRGMTLQQLQDAIQLRLRKIYRNVQVSVSLEELRTITVTLGGNAFAPGSYTIPAVASAFNLLYAAGGPTRDGSFRDIQIMRQGRTVERLDFYKFWMTGKQSDIPLQSGDLIYIPPAEAHVFMRGEVRESAEFELKDGETLADALKYCNGVKPSGVEQEAQVKTLDPGSSRVIRNVDLRNPAETSKTPLYDGATVDVFSVRTLVSNEVTVEGAVDQPNQYGLIPGMRVADLVNMARGPLGEAYLGHADLIRWNSDNTTTLIPIDLEKAIANDPKENVTLQRWDKLKVFTRDEIAWTGKHLVTVRGAVQKPGVYYYSRGMRISDLLMHSGGPAPDAYYPRAALLHQRGDGTYRYEFVNLNDALNGGAEQNVELKDNDLLAIYRVGEAQFQPDHVVTVKGEVVGPGIYPRGDAMRLTDLLALSGGFKPGAGTSVTIAHAHRTDGEPGKLAQVTVAFDSNHKCAPQDDLQLQDGDVVAVTGTGGLEDHPRVVVIKGAVNQPGPVILSHKDMRLSEAIKQAGGLRPEAFPDGAEFVRDPRQLTSKNQADLAYSLEQINDLINKDAYLRKLATSAVEKTKAVTEASTTGGSPLTPTAAPTSNPAGAAIASSLQNRETVTPARAFAKEDLQPNGNIAVNLPEALHRPNGSEDIILADGDVINVPDTPTTIQVLGAVNNARGVLFRSGAPVDYYVINSGGYTADAARDKAMVIRAGGGLRPANKVRELKPGDVIYVPTRVLADKIASNQNSFNNIFTTIASPLILLRLLGL